MIKKLGESLSESAMFGFIVLLIVSLVSKGIGEGINTGNFWSCVGICVSTAIVGRCCR